MNELRRLGFIEYNGELGIHGPLLSVVLHDRRAPAYHEGDCFPESSAPARALLIKAFNAPAACRGNR
jgi:hypothetical protein